MYYNRHITVPTEKQVYSLSQLKAEKSLELHRKIDFDRREIMKRDGYSPLVLIEFLFDKRDDVGLCYRILSSDVGFRTFFAATCERIDECVDATREEQESVADSLRINSNYLNQNNFQGNEDCELCSAFDNERYRLIGSNESAFAMSINRHLGMPFDKYHSLVLPIAHVELLDNLTEQQSLDTHLMLWQLARKIFDRGSPFVIAGINSPKNATQRHFHYQIVASPESLDKLIELNEYKIKFIQ